MKVPNLEQLITQYEQQQTRIGKWTNDPNNFNKCLECGSGFMEHKIITIIEDYLPELALVCPDYIEKYEPANTHDKLLRDTVTFL